ncbi:DUF362 domain-containing protein [Natrialba sp. INN-245]|uniref:DUF362 domain-containing protein n=1 Tax=Natrialba sp. INN-245 TaxID=2690967 RepID=UPI0013131BC8|nr:DUF362 domain-containing protein [Natrialba sp. INN-245]MWV39249.1 DUF362 domain-containing protein [Natrialba sp. INN-245]
MSDDHGSHGRVRAAAVDAADRTGSWIPDVDARMATFESSLSAVLEPSIDSLEAADRIAVVPDVHYPFHPSTGMVTDPALLGALVAHLERRGDAEIDVCGAGTGIDAERTAAYLGYPAVLERFDATFSGIDDETSRTRVVRSVDDRSVPFAVPTDLLERTVVVVPTLRPTESGAVAGGMRTLAALGEGTDDPDATAVAAADIVDPTLSILDATTAYGGTPHAANAIFAGPTAPTDAVAASLLGRSIDEEPAVSLALEDGARIDVERVGPEARTLDVEAIGDRLSGGELPPKGDMHPIVTAAYRLYAAAGRDAVPPQLEGVSDAD